MKAFFTQSSFHPSSTPPSLCYFPIHLLIVKVICVTLEASSVGDTGGCLFSEKTHLFNPNNTNKPQHSSFFRSFTWLLSPCQLSNPSNQFVNMVNSSRWWNGCGQLFDARSRLAHCTGCALALLLQFLEDFFRVVMFNVEFLFLSIDVPEMAWGQQRLHLCNYSDVKVRVQVG